VGKSKIIEARGIRKYYKVEGCADDTSSAQSSRGIGICKAIDDLNLDIKQGEVVALIGESGCGKTTLTRVLLGLESPTSGEIFFEGRGLKSMNRLDKKRYITAVQAVFQNPYSSLNPRMRVREIISEPLISGKKFTRKEKKERVADLLQRVGLPSRSMDYYPHEFSGGQRQRIAIARSLWAKPRLIILDEPVSGLDVSIRAQNLNLLKDLNEKSGISYLLISHDLGIVKYTSHRVAVMYLGRIVELASTKEILADPKHPYTKAMIKASFLSKISAGINEESFLSGEVPNPINLPPGCAFHPRCKESTDDCRKAIPELISVAANHFVACNKFLN